MQLEGVPRGHLAHLDVFDELRQLLPEALDYSVGVLQHVEARIAYCVVTMIIKQVFAPVMQRTLREGIFLLDWKFDHREAAIIAHDKPLTIRSKARLNSVNTRAYDGLCAHLQPSVCLGEGDVGVVEAAILWVAKLAHLIAILLQVGD